MDSLTYERYEFIVKAKRRGYREYSALSTQPVTEGEWLSKVLRIEIHDNSIEIITLYGLVCFNDTVLADMGRNAIQANTPAPLPITAAVAPPVGSGDIMEY